MDPAPAPVVSFQWGALMMVMVITLFAGLVVGFVFLDMNKKHILENWVQYRCNPAIMPFASFLGKDTVSNFEYCIMNSQTSYIGFLLEPIYYLFGEVTTLLGDLTSSVDSIRSMITSIRGGFLGITGMVFGKMAGTTSEVVILFTRMRDILGRMMGSMTALMYGVNSATTVGQSMMNGPVGQVINFFCFDPATPIRLSDASVVPISSIAIGNVLEDGSVVTSTMVFDGSGAEMYDVSGVVVSGTHLLLDPMHDIWRPVASCGSVARPLGPRPPRKNIVCLNTDTHRIPVSGFTFRDFEEVSDSETVRLIHEVISAELNKGAFVPAALSCSYDTGLPGGAYVILADGGISALHSLQVGTVLKDGAVVTGVLQHDASDMDWVAQRRELAREPPRANDILLGDTLVLDPAGSGRWMRAKYLPGARSVPGPARAFHLCTSTGFFHLRDGLRVRDDQESYDPVTNEIRDALVAQSLKK
jgi:hypothetical protein